MICAKCGTEYEGSQCPKCDGPVIKINNSDYLARRKAYEEKQAKLKRKEVPGKDRTDRITRRLYPALARREECKRPVHEIFVQELPVCHYSDDLDTDYAV